MWIEYIEQVHSLLRSICITDRTGAVLVSDAAFANWTAMAQELRPQGSIHLIGNGASASMASHFAADITKNCGIRANVFTDSALITAMGNDYGYENAYAVALERYARSGDMLVAISSSGNSPNIVNACHQARSLGMRVITVSGKKKTNTIRRLGDLNFYVAGDTFGLVESAHAVLLHYWTDMLLEGYTRDSLRQKGTLLD